MKKRFLCLLLTLLMLLGTATLTVSFALDSANTKEAAPLTDYVDMRYGVNNLNLCTIGPARPHASVTPGPDTYPASYSTGYLAENPIRGFSQIHDNCGEPKYGNFLISPQIGLSTAIDGHDSEKANENPTPAEYSVTLTDYDIDVSVAPAHYSSIYKFTYPKSDNASILIDVAQYLHLHTSKATNIKADISVENGNTIITGSGNYDNPSYELYFYAVVDKAAADMGTYKNDVISNSASLSIDSVSNDESAGAYMTFATDKDETVMLKIAVSFTSVDKAKSYIEEEIPAWDYDAVKAETLALWEEQLGKIQISGENLTEEQKTMFYTNVYCAHKMPRDRTGDFEKFGNADMIDDHIAVWDTFRSTYPLYSITNPDFFVKTVNSFVTRLEVNGYVKDLFNGGNERPGGNQGGDNVDIIIAEAYLKGLLTDEQARKAYAVVKNNADNWRDDKNSGSTTEIEYSTYRDPAIGYIPGEGDNKIMCCSKTVEYAYNDYLVAMMAKGLGYEDDYETYIARSNNWLNIWNEEMEYAGFSGWLWPKTRSGEWIAPNSDLPDIGTFCGSWRPYFYEGTGYTYSFFVPHDVEKLIEKMGGERSFIERLKYGIDNGKIEVSNQPGMLQAYLFNHTSEPWHTSDYVDKLINRFSLEGGTPGCEDSGSLSSWYVFSTIGFFPSAGQDFYYLTSPKYETTTFDLDNGKTFTVKANNLSEENKYIQSVTLNGETLYSTTINHSDIVSGGELVFNMGSKPVDYASSEVAKGKTAGGYDWNIMSNGVLSITGSGNGVLDFDVAITEDNLSDIPWYDYRGEIVAVNIDENTKINSIADYVLSNLPSCKQVILPTTLTNLGAKGIFANCPKLVTVNIQTESSVLGEFHLYYMTSLGNDIFAGCAANADIKLDLGDNATFVPEKWFTNTTTVKFDLITASSADTWVKNVKNGSDTRAEGYKFSIGDIYSYIGGRERNKYSWVLEDGTLTFINPKLTWNELEFTDKYTAFAEWVANHGGEIKNIVIPAFSKFTIHTAVSPFNGLENLITVKCDATRWLMPNTCAFENCTALTTLGNSKNFAVGKIKLDTYRIEGLQDRDPNLFNGCTSITDVDFTGFTTSYTADKDLKPVALGSKMLAGCSSLENINLTGVTALRSGSLSNCTSLEEITIPECVTTIEANAFNGCTALETVNIEATEFSSGMAVKDSFPDQDGLTVYCQNRSVMDAFMAFGYEKTKVGNDAYVTGEETIDFGYAKYSYSWYLDKSSGVLTFVNPTPDVHNELYFNANTKAFTTWVADYKDYIKHIEIPYFSKFTVNTSSPFSNLKNLESVKIDAVRWVTNACGDLFDGCSSLTTLGTSENIENRKIKFAGIRFEGLGGGKQLTRFRNCTSITSIDYTGAMAYSDDGKTAQIMWICHNNFEGCTALEHLILGGVSKIGENAFKGCTSLKNVFIPASVTAIEDYAFSGCTSLTAVTLETQAFTDGMMTKAAFPDQDGLTIYCQNDEVVNSVNALGYTKTKAINANVSMENGIKMEGFSIRTKGYNGLRGIFSFDKSAITKNTVNGLTLVEYGTILASKANMDTYGSALTFDGTNYVTANHSVIKKAIWNGGDFVGAYLSDNAQETMFAISVINYTDNYDTDVVMIGYSIWQNADGNSYIKYVDCENDEFDSTSIYKVTLGMYKDGVVNAEDDPDDVIWDVLEACAATFTAGVDFRADDRDLEGNAFGTTMKMANLPVYETNSTFVSTGAYWKDKLELRGATYTRKGDLTYTILPDGDSYVAVIRGNGEMPMCDIYGTRGVSQLDFRYATNTMRISYTHNTTSLLYNEAGEQVGYVDENGKYMTLGYDYDTNPEMLLNSSEVHRRQPTPTLLSGVCDVLNTVILDDGITNISTSFFMNGNVDTVIYADTVKSLGVNAFVLNQGFSTLSPKGVKPTEGLIDLSGFTQLGGYGFNEIGGAQKVLLPKGVDIPDSLFASGRGWINFTAISTDRNTLIDGVADLRGITSIASRAFDSPNITKIYFDDSIKTLATDAFPTHSLTVYTSASNVDAVKAFADANESRTYVGGTSFEVAVDLVN